MNKKSISGLLLIITILLASFLPSLNQHLQGFSRSVRSSFQREGSFTQTSCGFTPYQDEEEWAAFVLPWNDGTPSALDGRFLLPEVAGEKGFLEVGEDGHFYFQEDGSRAKFWGTNVCWGGCFPTHEDAEIIAERLAKFGFNLVRFHKFDTEHIERGNIFSRDYPNDSRHFNATQIDRLDYFIYQLKLNGIYVLIDLHAERGFLEGDGVIGGNHSGKYKWIPESGGGWVNCHGKFLTIFNQTFIDLQKEFAENLLTHENPYTDLPYVDDPAIAFIEMTNENSMFLGYSTDYSFEHVRDTDIAKLADIHPYYLEQLNILWNEWLKNKYGSLNNLQVAWSYGEDPLTESNKIENGGFEGSTNPWNLYLKSGWSANAILDSSTKVEGSSSIKITLNNKGTNGGRSVDLNETIGGFSAGENYYLTFWAKASQFGVKIQPMLTAGDWSWGPNTYLGENWREYYCTLKATKTGEGKIVFNLGDIPNGTSVWFDDVQLYQGGVFGLREEESWENHSIARIRYDLRHSYTWNRFIDELDFYSELDYNYGVQMHDFLRAIGVKVPITVTNGHYGFASVPGRYEVSDYLDAHVYWDPPFAHNYAWTDQYVQVEDGGFIPDLMALGFKNKPLAMSEWNFLFPQPTQYQGPVMVGSYAAFQDVDALMLFSYYWNTGNEDLRANFIPDAFGIARNPSIMIQSLVGSILFQREVAPATTTLELNYTLENIYQNMNQSQGYVPTFYPFELDKNIYHIHGLRLTIEDPAAFNQTGDSFSSGNDVSVLAPPFVSDTNELIWDPTEGYFLANTSGAKVALGLLGGKIVTVGNLQLEMVSEHGSVALIALDNHSTNKSKHMLLITQSTSRNHNMTLDYEEERPIPETSGEKWGTAPTEILLVQGQVKITIEPQEDELISEETIEIFALDETGERAAQLAFTTSATPEGHLQIMFDIGEQDLPCYEIIVGEIPEAEIEAITLNPALVGEPVQFYGNASHQTGISRYMWGIRLFEGAQTNTSTIEPLQSFEELLNPHDYLPVATEAYSVFSWEENATYSFNIPGIYQIFFKAQATNGFWSNLCTATLFVEPGVTTIPPSTTTSPTQPQEPPPTWLWLIPTIIGVVVITITVTAIIILSKRKRKNQES